MSEADTAEKEHEPTQHKLDEARRKGDLVRSTDLTVAVVYLGFLMTATGLGAWSLTGFGTRAMGYLDQLGRAGAGRGFDLAWGWLAEILLIIAPWFVLPALAAILSLAAQRAIVVAPDKLQFKLSRIDPIKNAGQKFGRNGLFEFAKSFVKLLVVSALLGVFILDHLPRLLLAQRLEPALASAELGRLINEFLVLVTITAMVFGGIDYFWQRAEHLRRNRMSRQEMIDEMKNSEGDPHMKAQRRQRGMEIATNRMLSDVPGADVIVVNPTHYAVALKWEKGSGRAPVCLAKGVDEIAARIREAAMTHGVPIHSDPPTARALFATIDIGDEIQPQHYRPVAAAIRFAEKMRRQAKERKGA